MAERRTITPACDRHPDEEARVLCRQQRNLLCFSCGLKMANRPGCSVIEIRKLSTDQDRILVQNLAVKQLVKNKKHLVETHDAYMESLKCNLVQKVLDVHFQLVQRLDELKDDCLKRIETQTVAITKTNKEIRQQLVSIENTIDRSVNKVLEKSTVDLKCLKSTLEEVKTELMSNILIRNSRPEGVFEPNSSLCNTVLQRDLSFGHVTINDGNSCKKNTHFPQINTEEKSKDMYHRDRKDLQRSDTRKTEVNTRNSKAYKRSPLSVQLSSDEVPQDEEDDYLRPISHLNSARCSSIRSDLNEKEDKTSQPPNVLNTNQRGCITPNTKSFGGVPTHLSSSSKTLDVRPEKDRGFTEEDPYYLKSTSGYREGLCLEFDSSNSIFAEFFMNKTVMISGMRQHFRSACKFCKVVYLGGSAIGMLSKVHNTVVIVNLNGSVINKKRMSDLVNIAAVGEEKLALLTENGSQVCIVDVNSIGCSTTESFLVDKGIANITGFDFDVSSSLFALSSQDRVVILDKTGHLVASYAFNSTPSPSKEIISVYDFQKSCIYILNIQNRTLKCGDATKGGDEFSRYKYNDSNFIPRSLCLYNDTICIACKDEIVQLFADDGSLFVRHDTKGILEDCLGMCVIGDVIVFTSNSDNFENSAKLACSKLS